MSHRLWERTSQGGETNIYLMSNLYTTSQILATQSGISQSLEDADLPRVIQPVSGRQGQSSDSGTCEAKPVLSSTVPLFQNFFELSQLKIELWLVINYV